MIELAFGRVGFGAANLGNLYRPVSEEASWEVLDAAWDGGVRYFDTAPHYGLGLSEQRLGAFLRTKPRDQFIISTKVGRLLRPMEAGDRQPDTDNGFAVQSSLHRVWDPSPSGIVASLEESLERLGLDSVDVLYLHDPEAYGLEDSLRQALPALAAVRKAGLVSAVGVGSMSTAALLKSTLSGLVDLLMVAGRWTLAEQEGIPELISACEQFDVGIVTASIFNSGLLASNEPNSRSRHDYSSASRELVNRARALAATCADFGVELPAAALQYTLRYPIVRSVVVGTSSAEQMRENLRRMNAPIPEALWQKLSEDGCIF